jgi:endoglucanase
MRWLPSTPAREMIRDLARLAERTIGDPEIDREANQRHLTHAALASYVGALMQPAYAKRFKGLSEADIDRVLQSFAFRNCRPHQGLIDVFKKHMARPA